MHTFAKQLNAIRMEKHITQEQLAQMMNVSRTTISRWESGKVLPDIETIKRLSQVLNYNFFTVEGLSADAPEEDVPPAEDAPQEKKPGKKRYWLIGAAVVVLCLLLGIVLLGKEDAAQITASAAREQVYLTFAEDGGLRWDMCFIFENTGSAAFTPEGAAITCFEGDACVFQTTVLPEQLAQMLGRSTLVPGGQALEIPFGSNMLNMTRISCRLYGKDAGGQFHEAASTVELLSQTEQAARQKNADASTAEAACIIVTADKDVACLEPFEGGGFGWNIAFYFENSSPVAFVPDGVEVVTYQGDTAAFTSFTPYEVLRPHMTNGQLVQGSVPLHFPVGVNLLDMTSVVCRIFGTDEKGNPVDVSLTVPLSQEYRSPK